MKTNTPTHRTVSLKGTADNERLKDFTQLFSTIPNTEIISSQKLGEYNIFFDFSGFEDDKNRLLASILAFEQREDKHTILDVTRTNFSDESESPYYILAVTCADYVTCPNPIAQEAIYQATGRLAHIVESLQPSTNTGLTTTPPTFCGSTETRVGWYGPPIDIMSIKPFMSKASKQYLVGLEVFTPCTLSNTETQVYRSEKSKVKKITEDIDIVFLPTTLTEGGEERRYRKVVESTNLGKLVVAPKLKLDLPVLEDLAKAHSLLFSPDIAEAFVENAQRTTAIKLNQSKDKSKEDLIKVLENTPDLNFKKDFHSAVFVEDDDDEEYR